MLMARLQAHRAKNGHHWEERIDADGSQIAIEAMVGVWVYRAS
jgi:hypothetical protein